MEIFQLPCLITGGYLWFKLIQVCMTFWYTSSNFWHYCRRVARDCRTPSQLHCLSTQNQMIEHDQHIWNYPICWGSHLRTTLKLVPWEESLFRLVCRRIGWLKRPFFGGSFRFHRFGRCWNKPCHGAHQHHQPVRESHGHPGCLDQKYGKNVRRKKIRRPGVGWLCDKACYDDLKLGCK